ncbi:MAG: L,D-transpeptidase family protein, partial [Desulfovibrionales bacterium]|nr:L,D-transpeptidase family protein [Desulfovibrionales bacterium]
MAAMVAQMLVAEGAIASRRTVVIDKAKGEAVVFLDDRPVARFPASFGIDPKSDKHKAFDCATPEGLYMVTNKNDRSRFHRTLGLSYPNPANAEKALAEGVISLAGYTRIRDAAWKS